MDFRSYPTKTHLQVEPFTELEYPDVIICAQNALNVTKLKKNFTDDEIRKLFNVFEHAELLERLGVELTDKYKLPVDEKDKDADGSITKQSDSNKVPDADGSPTKHSDSNTVPAAPDGNGNNDDTNGKGLKKGHTDRDKRAVQNNGTKSESIVGEALLPKGHEHLEVEELLMNFALSPELMIANCKIRGKPVDCFSGEMAGRTVDSYGMSATGMCFTMHPPKVELNGSRSEHTARQNVPGRAGAWSFDLSRTIHSNLSGILPAAGQFWEIQFAVFDNPAGWGSIANPHIWIESGKEASIAIRETRTEKLDEPYGKCLSHREFLKYVAEGNLAAKGFGHNMELCYKECQVKQSSKLCGTSCVLPGFFSLAKHDSKSCKYRHEIECLRNSVQIVNCTECEIPCKYKYWGKRLEVANRHDASTDTHVEIFHEFMVLEVLSEVPSCTLFDTISNIGASLTFWLGLKICTFVQLLYYGTVWATCKKIIRPKKIDTDNIPAGSYDVD